MSEIAELPEPDRIEGAPHPREAVRLFGHETAEAEFLDAFNSGRLHHGWLISGPRGVGKATLAWRIARFLLTRPAAPAEGLFGEMPDAAPESLDVDPEHPVVRHILSRSATGLFHITRGINEKTKRRRDVISVDEVRGLGKFFHLSASDGGRRVVIVDTMDEMTTQAANALLKLLEEPPANATLLLVSHQPAGLLPTIRSRCRTLRLHTLNHADMAAALVQAGADPTTTGAALAELSGGSVGEALRFANLDGLTLYHELVAIVGTLPRLDRGRALRLADSLGGREAATRMAMFVTLLDILLARLARTGATGAPPLTEAAPGEAQILSRLSPTPAAGRAWATTAQEVSARVGHARAVNLDPAALILDTVFKLQQTAA